MTRADMAPFSRLASPIGAQGRAVQEAFALLGEGQEPLQPPAQGSVGATSSAQEVFPLRALEIEGELEQPLDLGFWRLASHARPRTPSGRRLPAREEVAEERIGVDRVGMDPHEWALLPRNTPA